MTDRYTYSSEFVLQAQARIRCVFELTEFMEQVFRQRMRRENPEITDSVIEERVQLWYLARPGEELQEEIKIPMRASDE